MNKYILLIIWSLCTTYTVQAQFTTTSGTANINLPVVALLDIEPLGNVSLTFLASTEAGTAIINPVANTTKWVNYSSAIVPNGRTRKIAVSINEEIPGINLTIQASNCISGGGVRGIPNPNIILTTVEQDIITGIGGAYTGNGTNNGHRLTIGASSKSQNYNKISRITNKQITITYTIKE